jgi:hypothetical protein
MKENDSTELTCPFCDEGSLGIHACMVCKKSFLLCDECESIYKDKNSLGEECEPDKCPHCGAPID